MGEKTAPMSKSMTLQELLTLADQLSQESRRRSCEQVPYSPQTPTAKQRDFLQSTSFEALFGGAAGGGKSSSLLMAALQYVHSANYSALLLRRTYADLSLPGAIMARSHEWLRGTDARWNGELKRWTFPSGATITFGYLHEERDRYRYQSAEFQFIGFDELTQFPEAWYRYLLSRVRRAADSTVPLRVRGASNPGGIGHDWVHRRFVKSKSAECTFYPSLLTDNPHLDQAEYTSALEKLDAITRSQLLEGRWVRDSGGLVYKFDEERNTTTQFPSCEFTILGMDYGFSDDTAFVVLGWNRDDPSIYVLGSYKQAGLTPSEAAELAHELEKRYRFTKIVGDVGGLGKGYAEEARKRFQLPIEAAEKNNKRGYQSLINADFELGRLKICKGTNDDLEKELLELPWKKDRSAEEDGFDNHLCFVGGTMVRTPAGERPIERIRRGDLVMTRRGPRRVLAAACTGVAATWRLETQDGRTLEGTPNHPIFVNGTTLVRLDSLLYSSSLVSWENMGPVKLSCSTASDSALGLVMQRSADFLASTTKAATAFFAMEGFPATNSLSRNAVPCLVRRTSKTGTEKPVFNLTVEDEHEYFANGILVSNCDALLYSWRACPAFYEREKPPPPSLDERIKDEGKSLKSAIERRTLEASKKKWWEKRPSLR